MNLNYNISSNKRPQSLFNVQAFEERRLLGGGA